MDLIDLPAHVDEPPHFLLWSADEMAPIVLGLMFGMFTGNALLLTLLGVALTRVYRRFRDNKPDGFLLHAIYWAGLLPSRASTVPNPFIRQYYV